ncbi:adenosylcobinamide-phosphate synthase CbiB [Luteibacter sp. PPL201]|uniref:Cobalamin biosynthesis protein CobD n=1 Tax=Luteibacter sahnii TaxID=3021977 RepID=A0ABT6BDD8_9GAMM|nr:adenosylcobinamide-phosphate synthase CbiB [Luteibacter sp. PPL193]MDY1549009.1 adenosylcobinamide-phosphate synthase CbiB [Luteibacter sp. PPL193]
MSVALAMVAAVWLDAWLGEARRYHPLVGFGRLASWMERRLNPAASYGGATYAGMAAWGMLVLIPSAATFGVRQSVPLAWAWGLDVVVLYVALGRRSLADHARPIATALDAGDLSAAREAVGRMVSRDTDALDATQVAGAATESVLENGHDAVFGALFWFALFGAPGAMLFRLANTLDAMWGYRTPRYLRFGWAAARADDVLGFLPARLTALSYAFAGRFAGAMRCWRTQARRWKSPNAGPVMAAGAGALGVALGGPAPYHGRWEARPALGDGPPADAGSVRGALRLVDRGVAFWLGVMLLWGVATHA